MVDNQTTILLNLAELDAEVCVALCSVPKFAAHAGFHAQQAVEKSLKALLSAKDVSYPLTHNLAVLLEMLKKIGLDCPVLHSDIHLLIPYAVDGRYDELQHGLTLDAMQKTTSQVLDWVRQLIDKENA